MKLYGIIFIIVNLILITAGLPSKFYYYPGARSAPYRNGMMYFQYVQPRYRNVVGGAVGAYSSGDTLATGTFSKPVHDNCNDQPHFETFTARVDLNNEKDSTLSVAEAYNPSLNQEHIPTSVGDKIDDFEEQQSISETAQLEGQQPSVEIVEDEKELEAGQPVLETEVTANRKDRTGGFDNKVNVEHHIDDADHYISSTTELYTENEVVYKNEINTNIPPTVVIPVISPKPTFIKPNQPKVLSIEPKKKVQVRLDYPSTEDEEEEEPIYTHYNRVVPKPIYLPNRGAPAPPRVPFPSTEVGGTSYAASQSSNKKKNEPPSQGMSQSFFPVYFGGDNGGSAIAIANSYSTGESGSATSHAIAYGSPSASQLRHKKVHKAAPVKRQ